MEENSVLDTSKDKLGFLENLAQHIPPKLRRILNLSQPIITAMYASNPTATTLISMAYIAGGEILNSIERRNVEIWVKEYVDRKIDNLINPDKPNTQEFVQHAILRAARCSKEAQVKRIVDVFQAALEGAVSSYEIAEDFMNVISELSENEAILLAQIYKYFEDNPAVSGFNEYKEEIFFNIPRYAWIYLLNRLEGKGLLNSEPTVASNEDVEKMINGIYGDNSNNSSPYRESSSLIINSKTYSGTEFGKKLFQSIT